MGEGLQTADGKPVSVPPAGSDEDLNAQFKMAMNAPEPDEPAMPAPPPKDPDAPYGRTKDGKPKRGPGGRPPKKEKAERPRTARASDVAGVAPKDYTTDLAELGDGVWFLLTISPQTHAQAALLKAHKPHLVRAVNIGAQNNRQIRTGVEYLTGGGTWVAAMGMALVPFVLQSVALWSGKMDAQTVQALAGSTAGELQHMAEQQAAEFAEATGIAQAA